LNLDVNPYSVQFLARFCLLSLNLLGWLRLALVVDRMPLVSPLSVFPKNNNALTEGSWLLLITASQFHIPFYSSRMLPNTFALAIVLQSFSYWLERRTQTAAALIVFGTAVFRCDLLLLLGSMGLSWIFRRELSIPKALKIGILTGIISLVITTPLDSLLWQRPIWPEGEVFYFNTILGKSKEWGLSPWHWYFTSALPKAMLLTIFLVPLSMFRIVENIVAFEKKWRQPPSNAAKKNDRDKDAIWVDKQWSRFIIPILGFIVLYSFLGHKEMRFIFPALPMLNLGAAVGMSKLTQIAFPPRLSSKDKDYFVSWIGRIGFGCGLLSIGLTLVGSLIFVMTSQKNYSGGDALMELSLHVHKVVSNLEGSETEGNVSEKLSPYVHIDVASAMSGVSLFGQRAAQATAPNIEWKFSKDGYEESNSALGEASGYEQFTHLLSEDPSIVSTSEFSVIHIQPGRPRLDLRKRKIVTEDSIFVLERNGWGT
jgi:alpha-1,6-mannosyltransferase